MAKPDKPLLSLGARGTIADALTFQKRGLGTIVRQKPIPKDPYTLAQAYQRWDYRDYAYLWTLLSNSEKQIYRTKASKYHITGFSQWMRESLKDLTNLAGRWHLDERSGAIAYDSSKNENHLTISGPSPTTGPINGALYFDGLNDLLFHVDAPIFHLQPPFTIEVFIDPNDVAGFYTILEKDQTSTPAFEGYVLMITNNTLYFAVSTGAARLETMHAYTSSALALIHAIDDGTTLYLYVNGSLLSSTVVGAHTIAYGTNPFTVGRRSWVLAQWFPGTLDNLVIYDRVLDQTEIKRHSERRYPV